MCRKRICLISCMHFLNARVARFVEKYHALPTSQSLVQEACARENILCWCSMPIIFNVRMYTLLFFFSFSQFFPILGVREINNQSHYSFNNKFGTSCLLGTFLVILDIAMHFQLITALQQARLDYVYNMLGYLNIESASSAVFCK